MTDIKEKLRGDVLEVIQEGISSVNPENAINRDCFLKGEKLYIGPLEIDLQGCDRIYVLGAGKGSGLMARAMEKILAGRIEGGIISVKKGYGADLKRVEIIVAGHPVPDDNSLRGAQKAVEMARSFQKTDLVICLLSGGASALWSLPAGEITFEEKARTTEVLLGCGADIRELNTVRKHISGIKGGWLTSLAHPARVLTLVISDVVGDELSSIGSGPTVPDPSTYQEALSVADKYGLSSELPKAVLAHLRAGSEGRIEETPKPGDPIFQNDIVQIVASNGKALRAAEQAARRLGYNTHIISSQMTGESREVGKALTALLKRIIKEARPVPPPAMLLCGGETTVTVRGTGKGGRNQELVLAAALEIAGLEKVVVVSVGTDGSDGPTDAAGAFADGGTIQRAETLGLDAHQHLMANNSYEYFDKLRDLIRTGPTGTNVMDIQVLVAGG